MGIVDRLIRVDALVPKTILVVGDPMTDVYLHGQMHTTCQDNCPKFVTEYNVVVPGGAGNAVRSLKNWRAAVMFPFKHFLGAIKNRLVVNEQYVLRYDCEYMLDCSRVCANVLDTLHTALPSAVLISDYDKGALTEEFIASLIAMCENYNIPCVADCKREPNMYAGAILKCNLDYLRKYSSYIDKFSPYVVTKGAEGPVVCTHEWTEFINKTPPVKCVNHVGAGDCFAAHLTLALAHGFTLKDATAIAHAAGRVYVQVAHNEPPRPEAIRADMASWLV